MVEIDGVPIESDPRGHLLVVRNRDVPGVVGRIGTILGNARVNIGGIQLGRGGADREPVSILDVDTEVPPRVLAEIEALDDILFVRAVTVQP
jgi:D-3-phosphoglycerate dehydrogenase